MREYGFDTARSYRLCGTKSMQLGTCFRIPALQALRFPKFEMLTLVVFIPPAEDMNCNSKLKIPKKIKNHALKFIGGFDFNFWLW